MLPQLKIHVDGSGSVFRTAERGVLHINVSKSSKSQQEASDAVRETSASLTTQFRTHALKTEGADGRPAPHPDAGVTAFTASSLSNHAQPEYEWVENKRRDRGVTHTASSTLEVVFRDLVLLADTAGELAAMPHVAITSTEWRLTAATCAEIEREARKKAIENAVQKAEDYAGVVGRRRDHGRPRLGRQQHLQLLAAPFQRRPGAAVWQLQRNDAAGATDAGSAAAAATATYAAGAGANDGTGGRATSGGASKRGTVGRAEDHHGLGNGERQVYLGGRGAGQHLMTVYDTYRSFLFFFTCN